MRYPADLRKEAALAVEIGWKLVQGGSGHLKWFDQAGRLILVTAMTPGKGKRSSENAKARLKRHGIRA